MCAINAIDTLLSSGVASSQSSLYLQIIRNLLLTDVSTILAAQADTLSSCAFTTFLSDLCTGKVKWIEDAYPLVRADLFHEQGDDYGAISTIEEVIELFAALQRAG